MTKIYSFIEDVALMVVFIILVIWIGILILLGFKDPFEDVQ